MTACVTDAGGGRWTLPPATAWRLEYTAGVPCDSFWLRCPWEGDSPTRPGDWVGFQAEQDGERVFTGLVDECEVTADGRGRVLELSGRGMAARLLDNEALGQDYLCATQADILRDHVTPYGIETAPGAALGPVSRFSVAAGSSEWSVVYDFARYYGGVAPRFDRQGRLVLTGWKDSRERVVDDATHLISLLRRDKRYGVLSQTLVRDRWSGRVETAENAAFQAAGGRARRVITMPTRSSYKAMRYSGQFQLDKSASELARVEVTVGEAFCAWPGDLVTVRRSGWDWNGRYRAAQVTVGMDESGCWSRLELAEPEFTV
ncbi:hypothetical protein D1641_12830 [Colidextribacter sp. OB.20]|uniref:hypothetical protein n=1 Tax=Colidextribacter sp. OB.20 TaxID=2304568 RepID=UPI001370A7DD|nr:hypothetical protein [Colidextribacter sp. OB.20]